MSLRFIDELVPNGKTFPIADANNVRGGLHYAETEDERDRIHTSRLAPGVQCYVEETDIWYEYSFEEKKWVRSRIGNSLYVCTQNGVSKDEKSAETIGVLEPTSRGELEKMTLNEIFTRVFFAEKMPYYSETKPTWSHAAIEVGMPLAVTQWTPAVAGKYSYGYLNGQYMSGTIIEDTSKSRTLAHAKALFSTQNNAVTIPCKYNPIIETLGTSLKTSWDRTRTEYTEATGKPLTAPTIPLKANQTYNATGSYVGFYKAKYVASPRVGVMTTLSDDIRTLATGGILTGNSVKDIATNITGPVNDIAIASLPNSAYVYVMVPTALKISTVKMLNGLTAQYDTVPASRYGKVSAGIGTSTLAGININAIPKMNGSSLLYSYTLWYIAKGDKNASGEVSPSDAALKISFARV